MLRRSLSIKAHLVLWTGGILAMVAALVVMSVVFGARLRDMAARVYGDAEDLHAAHSLAFTLADARHNEQHWTEVRDPAYTKLRDAQLAVAATEFQDLQTHARSGEEERLFRGIGSALDAFRTLVAGQRVPSLDDVGKTGTRMVAEAERYMSLSQDRMTATLAAAQGLQTCLTRWSGGVFIVALAVLTGPSAVIGGAARMLRKSDRPADEQDWVMADRDRLERVVINLLLNSAKYSPLGSTIEMRAWQHGANAMISVKDQGSGMSAEDIEIALRPFGRGRAGRSAAQGTGLGLAIVKETVEAHGGAVVIESEVGRGTTVTVSLPLPEEAGSNGGHTSSGLGGRLS